MKTIAIEEHFITPMYRQKVAANEFRNFYLSSRSEQIGHDIVEQNSDLGAKRLAHMDAAGIDVQVLSFGSPGAQGFAADVAIPMARDANDLAHEAVKAHPDRFAAFAALATADPRAAADELGRCVAQLGFKGAMIHGHTQGSFLDEKKYWVIFERAQRGQYPVRRGLALRAEYCGNGIPEKAFDQRRGPREDRAPQRRAHPADVMLCVR